MSAKTMKQFGPEFKLPTDAPNACCLAIVNREDGKMGKIPLSEIEFEGIWKMSIRHGALPLEEFIAEAIREKVEREAVSAGHSVDFLALENAAAANSALMELLFDHMQLEGAAGQSSSFGGRSRESGTLLLGVSRLINMCRENLNKSAALS